MDIVRDAVGRIGNSDATPKGTSTNVGNTYNISCVPAYLLGNCKDFIQVCNADSTGAVALNPSGTGIKAGVKPNGSPVTNLKNGGIYHWIYNSVTGNFCLLGEGGEYGTATSTDVLNTKTIGTETGLVTGGIVPRVDKTVNNLVTGMGISMRNIIYNGNFSIGDPSWWACANWVKFSGNDIFTTGSNKASFRASARWGGIYQQLIDPPTAGDKIYMKADVKSPYAAGLGFYMALHYKTDTGMTPIKRTTLAANTWETMSAVYTVPSDFIFSQTVLAFRDDTVSGWQNIEVTNIVGVNLTKTFGAGAEPTQAQMDAAIAALGGFFMLISTAPKGYIMHNLTLPNPQFEDNLTYWVNTTYATVATNKVRFDSKSLKIAIPSAQVYAVYQGIANFGATGHKLYCCGWCNIESSTNAVFKIQLDDFDGSVSASNAQSPQFTTMNSWQFNSVCLTSTKSGARVELYQTNGGGYGTCYFDGLGLYDLTAIFGAGNEPSQAQMDALMLSLGGYITSHRIVMGVKVPKGAYLNDNQEILVSDSCLTAGYLMPQFNSSSMQGTATMSDSATPYYLLPTKTATVKGMGIGGICAPKIPNLIINGSFENSLNMWVADAPIGVVPGTCKHGSKCLQLYSSANGTSKIANQIVSLITGHKYYQCGWFLRTGSLSLTTEMDIIGGSPEMFNIALSNTTIPTINQWYHLSAIDTCTAGSYLFRLFTYNTEPVYCDNLMLIDLTESFGAGREPSKAVMDGIIYNCGTDWWDSDLTTLTNNCTAVASDLKAGTTAYIKGARVDGSRTYYPPGSRPLAAALWTGGAPDIYLQLPDTGGCWDSDVYIHFPQNSLIPGNIKKNEVICGVTGTYDPTTAMKNYKEATATVSTGYWPISFTIPDVQFTPSKVFIVSNIEISIANTTSGGNSSNIFSNMGYVSRQIGGMMASLYASISMNGTTATITLNKSGSYNVSFQSAYSVAVYLYS